MCFHGEIRKKYLPDTSFLSRVMFTFLHFDQGLHCLSNVSDQELYCLSYLL